MLKTRKDFQNDFDYKKYTRTLDFLEKYSWRQKELEKVAADMAYESGELEYKYLSQAMKELSQEEKYSGFDLDSKIVRLIEMNEDEGKGIDIRDFVPLVELEEKEK